MGFVGDLIGRMRISDPVPGRAEIVACSPLTENSGTSANCRMTLVVRPEGMEPFARDYHCQVKLNRWPRNGQSLPVTVDRDNPKRMKIEWGRIPTAKERARDAARARVGALRGLADR